jgi:opacity protein-like surface antigen
MKGIFLTLALAGSLLVSSASLFAQQNLEITGYVGYQINGGVDLSTTRFHRIDVGNGTNYGVSLGYLIGEHSGVEFQWNQNNADTVAEPIGGGPSVKLFSLTQNQYMGNYLFHFKEREATLRPFLLVGLGASSLTTDRSGVQGTTRFTFAVGGGAKYHISKHIALRGQLRYSPTYLTTTSNGGFWCDPFWGGCWVVGNDHYLNAFDMTGGITLRF